MAVSRQQGRAGVSKCLYLNNSEAKQSRRANNSACIIIRAKETSQDQISTLELSLQFKCVNKLFLSAYNTGRLSNVEKSCVL